MPAYALDANVLIGWVLERRPSAMQFLQQIVEDDRLYANPLLLAECTSVLRREVFYRRLLHEEASALLRRLMGLPFEFITALEHYPRALELAQRFQHKKAYDMLYLAMAESVGATMVSLDRGLHHAARDIGVPVVSLQ